MQITQLLAYTLIMHYLLE